MIDNLSPTAPGKLLEITIDDKTTYSAHTNNITNKASQSLNLLKQLSDRGGSFGTMRNIHTSYIRPLFETIHHLTTHNIIFRYGDIK